MPSSFTRVLAGAVAMVCGAFGASVHGQLVDFVAVEGSVSADAYALDWKTGNDSLEVFEGTIADFEDLPVSGGASGSVG